MGKEQLLDKICFLKSVVSVRGAHWQLERDKKTVRYST